MRKLTDIEAREITGGFLDPVSISLELCEALGYPNILGLGLIGWTVFIPGVMLASTVMIGATLL